MAATVVTNKANKKNDQHRVKAYVAFATSFAPLSLDQLVTDPPTDGTQLDTVQGLTWLWLVNSGSGAMSHVGAADKALVGIEGLVEIVDWLHKVRAFPRQPSPPWRASITADFPVPPTPRPAPSSVSPPSKQPKQPASPSTKPLTRPPRAAHSTSSSPAHRASRASWPDSRRACPRQSSRGTSSGGRRLD